MKRILTIAMCILLLFTGCVRKVDTRSSEKKEVFTKEDDKFKLQLFINGTEFKSTDKIDIYATLEYIGDKDEIRIWHGEPYFNFTITDHKDFNTGGTTLSVLKSTVLKKGEEYKFPYGKNGAFNGDDPDAEFWEAFYKEKDLYLPKGEYTISGYCDFSFSESVVDDEYSLSVEAKIKVN